jgi:hypothetical protein
MSFMLSVTDKLIMLSVIMISVIMLSVVVLNVVAFKGIFANKKKMVILGNGLVLSIPQLAIFIK